MPRACLTRITACLLLLLTFQGCTVVGIGIGTKMDQQRARWIAVDSSYESLPKFSEVRLTVEGGTVLEGRFLGWTTPDRVALGQLILKRGSSSVIGAENPDSLWFADLELIEVSKRTSTFAPLLGFVGLAMDILVYIQLQNWLDIVSLAS